MKTLIRMITENPGVKVSVRKNIDYSRMEIEKNGFIVKAWDDNTEETTEEEFDNIESIHSFLSKHAKNGTVQEYTVKL